jgi:hypothetical protein
MMVLGEYCRKWIEWKISTRMSIETQVASIFGMMRDSGGAKANPNGTITKKSKEDARNVEEHREATCANSGQN